MLPLEHPDTEIGIYIDADAYVRKDLTSLLTQASLFNSTQWCGMAQECELNEGYYFEKMGHLPFYKPNGEYVRGQLVGRTVVSGFAGRPAGRSVGRSAGRSVGQSVGRSDDQSVGRVCVRACERASERVVRPVSSCAVLRCAAM